MGADEQFAALKADGFLYDCSWVSRDYGYLDLGEIISVDFEHFRYPGIFDITEFRANLSRYLKTYSYPSSMDTAEFMDTFTWVRSYLDASNF